MKTLLLLAALALPLPGPTHVWKVGDILPEHIVRPLVIEAAQLARYPVPADTPKVLMVSGDELKAAACPGVDDCVIYGLYSVDTPDVLYINADIPAWRQSVTIVHEAVHFLQHRAGALPVFTCLMHGASEMEAHGTAFRYMNKHGIEGDMMPPNFACIKGINW